MNFSARSNAKRANSNALTVLGHGGAGGDGSQIGPLRDSIYGSCSDADADDDFVLAALAATRQTAMTKGTPCLTGGNDKRSTSPGASQPFSVRRVCSHSGGVDAKLPGASGDDLIEPETGIAANIRDVVSAVLSGVDRLDLGALKPSSLLADSQAVSPDAGATFGHMAGQLCDASVTSVVPRLRF